MKVVSTSNAPAAIGPYSQGFVVGNLLITSGQIPVNPENGEIPGDITSTCFLADMADFATFNGVYEKYFTSKPARSCVAVKTLPKNVLCEIEAIAEI